MRGRITALMVVGCLMIAAALAGALMPRPSGAQFLSPGKLASGHADIDGDAN